MTAAPENAEAPPQEAGQPAVAENSNAIAVGLLGDEWNLTIVKLAIMSGVRRYKDFRDMLGIANSVLTVRLRRLTEAGVFTMRQYFDAPRRYEYVLTECGRDLWQVLLTIWSWEASWVTEHIEPLPAMYHKACGEEFSPVMHCRACGQPAGIRDVRGTFGPSGGFARSVPQATTRRRSTGGSPGPGLVSQTIELSSAVTELCCVDVAPEPAGNPNDTSAMITNPSAQTVSMIACTRVRIAYANVASTSAATITAVPSLARTVSGKLQKQAIRAGLSSVAVR